MDKKNTPPERKELLTSKTDSTTRQKLRAISKKLIKKNHEAYRRLANHIP